MRSALAFVAAAGCGSPTRATPAATPALSNETSNESAPAAEANPHRVAGVITVAANAASFVKEGGSIFVIAKKVDADGTPTGVPLMVDKLVWHGSQITFELDERHAMVAGVDLTGEVQVMARFDGDDDALSKLPGDVVGKVRVTLPNSHVTIVLDDVLR